MFSGKKIILGVTGSIAAYKAAVLLRLLVKNGAEVRVVMSATAKQFIAPLTLATLAKNAVWIDFFNPENGEWNSHVKLGLWADLYLIAPATANTIGKMANGIADNLLLTTYLSAKCPVALAPAMDADMFAHSAVQHNLSLLQSCGVHIFEPTSGELASGLEGKGRMEEPEKIVEKVAILFQKKKSLNHKTVLITAGPTYEDIDSVRFISNASSGKMGYALAEELAGRGAQVQLVSGPVNIVPHHAGITLHKVRSAKEMLEASLRLFPRCQIAVMTAAVADFTPQSKAGEKLKRGEKELQLTLLPTQDIAATLGKTKQASQFLAGFALETQNEMENAQRKLQEKNLDMIVLNSLNDKGAGFNVPTNKITIIEKNGTTTRYPLKSKTEVACDVVNKIESLING